ncbi:MFS transporter [Inquilinus sp. Marseille-Q2685]|uniref:MFS transporter n=1 Tax=Inquilinus sp. Marseille-Q2685 TaxID=2866581 RepID=UPI0021035EBE|nr:MFS transporter [Inquilinus sp. Marseille-Q2685]
MIVVLASAAAILSISMGLRQSLGLFMEPMVQAGTVSVAAFGFAMAVQNLVWGLGQPFMGALSDKYGGTFVIIGAAVLFAAGLALTSMGTGFGLYVGGGLLTGIAVAGASHGVLVGILSRIAAPQIRAAVISILAAAGSLGTFVLAPLAQFLIERVNWQDALLTFAGLAATMAAFAFALSPRPRADIAPSAPKANAVAAIRQALSHPGYVAMTIAFFACGFQLIFVTTHLPKYVAICGLPPSVGAQAIALIGAFNAVGTLVAGHLGARHGNKRVLAAIYLLRTLAISVYAFVPATFESTLLFGAAMGFLWLSVIPPVSGLLNAMFGPTNFGALFGVMFVSHQIGAFLGAWLGGLAFDASGSYGAAWLSLVVVGGLAAAIQYLMDDSPRVHPA